MPRASLVPDALAQARHAAAERAYAAAVEAGCVRAPTRAAHARLAASRAFDAVASVSRGDDRGFAASLLVAVAALQEARPDLFVDPA